MAKTLKNRVFRILEAPVSTDPFALAVKWFIITLIVANVVVVMVETVEHLHGRYRAAFLSFEYFSVAVFSVEYVLRLWVCTEYRAYAHPVSGRLRYAIRPLALVDLFAVLPFYLPLLIPANLIFLRAFRLIRLMRILKLGRYSVAMRTFAQVISSRREELTIVGFTMVIIVVVASSLMYLAEREAQPNVFSSIPAAMWWAVVTMTTVGYGDTYPVTVLGKMLGALISTVGIGMFAVPAGVLCAGFLEQAEKMRKLRAGCPHCGLPLNGDHGDHDDDSGPPPTL